MAGTVKCKYCDSTISTNDKHCPNCGAPNEGYVDDSKAIITDPKTIEELKEYCAERGMPLVKMRFFIGEDFKEARAFGIYKESNGECVVYKNKDDGTRAVRYRGFDEAFAVGEIFQKLLVECHKRGIFPEGKSAEAQRMEQGQKIKTTNKKKANPVLSTILILAVAAIFAMPTILLFLAPIALIAYGIYKFVKKTWTSKGIIVWLIATIIISCFAGFCGRNLILRASYPSGYYQNGNSVYYNYSGNWYATDYGTDTWYPVYSQDAYDTLSTGDYVDSSYYYPEDDWDFVQFSDSPSYYDAMDKVSESSSNSWSSSSSDYDSWDSGSTDWGSDW